MAKNKYKDVDSVIKYFKKRVNANFKILDGKKSSINFYSKDRTGEPFHFVREDIYLKNGKGKRPYRFTADYRFTDDQLGELIDKAKNKDIQVKIMNLSKYIENADKFRWVGKPPSKID
jgi:hypothetical protein